MSHEVETMAYAGELPWHGLGTKVPGDLTPAQMLQKAGLDWSVMKIPSFIETPNDGAFGFNREVEKIATGQSALVRSSDYSILTNVSDNWEPVQNSDAFEFFHEFVMAGDMDMHTAGSLKNGTIVWALAKIKESFELFGQDTIESFLLFTNPHIYGRCIDVRFTPIRVVCNNTLTLSLQSKGDLMVRLNHRRAFDPEFVKKALNMAQTQMWTYKDVGQFLGSRNYTKESLTNYMRDVFPVTGKQAGTDAISRPAERALEVVETQPGAEFAPGTFWNAFNAVTFLADHELGHSADTRLTSSWYGVNRDRKNAALKKAVEYAEMV
jgi:phage/plasmid-like protein (TIGR03299 family)